MRAGLRLGVTARRQPALARSVAPASARLSAGAPAGLRPKRAPRLRTRGRRPRARCVGDAHRVSASTAVVGSGCNQLPAQLMPLGCCIRHGLVTGDFWHGIVGAVAARAAGPSSGAAGSRSRPRRPPRRPRRRRRPRRSSSSSPRRRGLLAEAGDFARSRPGVARSTRPPPPARAYACAASTSPLADKAGRLLAARARPARRAVRAGAGAAAGDRRPRSRPGASGLLTLAVRRPRSPGPRSPIPC